MDVVERFFAHEVNAYVRNALLEAIERRDRADFTFNIFNVRLDFEGGEVVVEDELEPDLEGCVPLATFEARLSAGA